MQLLQMRFYRERIESVCDILFLPSLKKNLQCQTYASMLELRSDTTQISLAPINVEFRLQLLHTSNIGNLVVLDLWPSFTDYLKLRRFWTKLLEGTVIAVPLHSCDENLGAWQSANCPHSPIFPSSHSSGSQSPCTCFLPPSNHALVSSSQKSLFWKSNATSGLPSEAALCHSGSGGYSRSLSEWHNLENDVKSMLVVGFSRFAPVWQNRYLIFCWVLRTG